MNETRKLSPLHASTCHKGLSVGLLVIHSDNPFSFIYHSSICISMQHLVLSSREKGVHFIFLLLVFRFSCWLCSRRLLLGCLQLLHR